MAFGWFKKKKTVRKLDYDPSNIKLNQLVKGAFVDFDLQTWEVNAVYEYDWGNDYFSDEFQLRTAEETQYLHVEEDDELECTLTRKIRLQEIEGDIADHIVRFDDAPSEIVYQGITFLKDSQSLGLFRNTESDQWNEMVSWTYYDQEGKLTISLSRYDEQEFEAAFGKVVQEFEFSNIIMP